MIIAVGISLLRASLSADELKLVRSTVLLNQLNHELLFSLLEASTVLQVSSGETLFTQGDDVVACFIVIDGWVKLYLPAQFEDETVVSVIGRGQSFAEAAVFSRSIYPVSAESVSDTRLLRIPRNILLKLISENAEFALSMLASTSKHLHRLVGQIEQLKTQSSAQRVARFLESLCLVKAGPCTIELPYDKGLIAGRLGMKPESLSRSFARLRDIGVKVERNFVKISLVEDLLDYANRGTDKLNPLKR